MESSFNTSARSPINLALAWSNAMAKLIHTGSVYNTHTLEAYTPKHELSVILCRPPAGEKSAEEQLFYLPQKWRGDWKQDKPTPAPNVTKPSRESQVLNHSPSELHKCKVEKSSSFPHPKHVFHQGKGSDKDSKL